MVTNSLVAKKPDFKHFITADGVKRRINEVIGGKDGQRFITAISSAVSTNPALGDCDHGTILNAALLGESLRLSPSPQLGQYYMVPFKDNKLNRRVATFVLGYKGYIQLAIRSGQYKKLNVIGIKEGELKHYDPLNEEIEVDLIQDEAKREETPTIGYYAMFEYINGFRKAMYWTKAKMEAHATKYSQGYSAHKGYTFWEKDFDGMAFKTMIRQLISKWGIMSIDMAAALEKDGALIKENGDAEYIEADYNDITGEVNEPLPVQSNPTGEPSTPESDDPFAD